MVKARPTLPYKVPDLEMPSFVEKNMMKRLITDPMEDEDGEENAPISNSSSGDNVNNFLNTFVNQVPKERQVLGRVITLDLWTDKLYPSRKKRPTSVLIQHI